MKSLQVNKIINKQLKIIKIINKQLIISNKNMNKLSKVTTNKLFKQIIRLLKQTNLKTTMIMNNPMLMQRYNTSNHKYNSHHLNSHRQIKQNLFNRHKLYKNTKYNLIITKILKILNII